MGCEIKTPLGVPASVTSRHETLVYLSKISSASCYYEEGAKGDPEWLCCRSGSLGFVALMLLSEKGRRAYERGVPQCV